MGRTAFNSWAWAFAVGVCCVALGAGGAARALVAALVHYGAAVTVYNRTVARAEALAEGTAQLPHVVPAGRVPVIGLSTEGAMIAGVLSGAAGAVTNLIAQARKVVGEKAHVFLTGGDAKRLAGLLPRDCCDIAAFIGSWMRMRPSARRRSNATRASA